MDISQVLSRPQAQSSLPTLKKTSYHRILKDKVTGIFLSLIRSLQSLYTTKPETDISRYSSHENYPQIFALKTKKMIGNATVLSYLQKLEDLEIDSSLLVGKTLDSQVEKEKVVIPIVLKGLFRDHIVTLFIDRQTHTIEFYDSKGLTIKDQRGRKLRFPGRSLTTLEEHVMAIWNNFNYLPDVPWTFKENTVRHQTDSYNCGVYVSNYIKRRLNGESFEDFEKKGLSFEKASYSARDEMILTILM